MGQAQQQQPTWVDMGTAHLDGKGRLVIPALIRATVFPGTEQQELVIRLSPAGHILLSPVRRRAG